jgi:hypothetical protein
MSSVAELKLLILRQQELAARLARNDQKQETRDARRELFRLLHELDVAQDALNKNALLPP